MSWTGGTPPWLGTVPAAFFDVDETLVAGKSMVTFLRYYLQGRGEPDGTYERLIAELHAAAATGSSREEINRRYYRLYAGEPVDRVVAAGRRWFVREVGDHGWVDSSLEAWRDHQAHAAAVGLVSGSFFACLDPVAEHLSATSVDATQLLIRRGRFTGEVRRPMIGEAKGAAVIARMRLLGFDPGGCAAYGDHSSDLPMLRAVGRPVVVGDDPDLVQYAVRHGWPRLPATTAPAAQASEASV